jgi:hypothetical protein
VIADSEHYEEAKKLSVDQVINFFREKNVTLFRFVNGSKFLILTAAQKDGILSEISGFYYPDLGTGGLYDIFSGGGEILVIN